ncbi:FxsB family cyclophane-forming radical SAM/SPASM peptide maturase [Actinoplanes sp. NPDC026619]|uniref:FxsB family cyclophane-forming radical SAM/SPASM peptide maturase n=1 Tax=Actinoplanes sp. NPDC026619 TaxID=3155798 RepID=UPI0033FCBD1B
MDSRAAPWPYADLDVAALRAGGHRPVPFREFVLKIHQRCNLACDYCYMYEHADQSWRERPRTMSDEVRDATLARIATHARTHDLSRVRIVLHGGEPLLYGPARLSSLVTAARSTLPCPVEFSMQTNGVLLTERTLAVLRTHGIAVGVSVDGTPAEHDRHRSFPSGKGSFGAVTRGLTLLQKPENQQVYGGLLCTVNASADPIACYQQLLEFAPPAIDLLLPHANWAAPPPEPVADWLIAVFDRWYGEKSPVRIRLFDDAIALVLGGAARGEQLGLSPSGVVVVESDGDIEQVDALKSAYPGACATGLNVLRDDFDPALDHPGIVARQIGRAALSDECLACPAVAFCGGGHYAHRYRPGAGFRNPSVYCADLQLFLRHVYDRVAADLNTLVGSSS